MDRELFSRKYNCQWHFTHKTHPTLFFIYMWFRIWDHQYQDYPDIC